MNAAERDAVRGVLWERKFRGRMEDCPPEDLEEARVTARRWLLAAADLPPVLPADSPARAAAQIDLGNRVGWGTYGWKYDLRLVEAALEDGAGLIDTAEGYGFGRVEKRLGELLRNGTGRTLLATKVARNHLSARNCVAAARRSRDALGVQSIDLYQVHWPVFPIEPTFDALAELLEEGTIKRVGVSNYCAGQVAAAVRAATDRGFALTSNQVRLNKIDNGAIDYLLPYCNHLGVGVIAYSPLNQRGMGEDSSDGLRWVLYHSVAAVIPATNDVGHLRANLRVGNEKTPAVRRGSVGKQG